jgi:hypothetical protein
MCCTISLLPTLTCNHFELFPHSEPSHLKEGSGRGEGGYQVQLHRVYRCSRCLLLCQHVCDLRLWSCELINGLSSINFNVESTIEPN